MPTPDISRAGLDAQEVAQFYCEVKADILENDKNALASLVKYPISVCIDGSEKLIHNKVEFLSNYNEIVNDKIRKIIKAQKYSTLLGRWQGIAFGHGQIWFNKPKGEQMLIWAIKNNIHCSSTAKTGLVINENK
jgi:hypothetical protein